MDEMICPPIKQVNKLIAPILGIRNSEPVTNITPIAPPIYQTGFTDEIADTLGNCTLLNQTITDIRVRPTTKLKKHNLLTRIII